MSTPTKLAGKAGSFVFATVTIPFTVIKPKVAVDFADSTDSANYDLASNLVHKSQIACMTQVELSVEGMFDLTKTPASFITQIYNGASGPVAGLIYLNATVIFGHGMFDLTDFETEIPLGDMVKWTATLKSNGIFTPNA